MSYTNNAGQEVNVGDRVAYAGYRGHLYLGKVIGFTGAGSPRIELEGKFVPMVRNSRNTKAVYVKHGGANIWDRRPYTHQRHKATGHLLTYRDWRKLPRAEWGDYEADAGQLMSHFIEFQVPATFTVVKRENVFVIDKATSKGAE